MIRESSRRDRGQFINQPRFQAKVRAMFGIDGENPVPSLSELLPVVVVENDRVESKFDGNEFIRANGANVAAGGAGNSSNVALVNPAGSGILVVIEAVAASATVYGRLNAAAPIIAAYTLSPNTGVPRDGRASGGGGGAQVWTLNTGIPPVQQFAYFGGISGPIHIDWVLSPGQAFLLWNATANTAAEIWFFYRDQALNNV